MLDYLVPNLKEVKDVNDRTKQLLKEFQELQKDPQQLATVMREAKLSEKWCPACGLVVWQADRYCKNCGTENPHFDPMSFQEVMGATLEQTVADECAKGHPCGDTPEERAAHTGFCTFCGQCFDAPQ